jgi:putative salt-induced outer membrane protein YdiY
MKKLSILILVLSLMLISASALADSHMNTNMLKKGTWTIGADYDMGGTLTYSDENNETEENVNSGFTINGEYIIPYRDKMSFGGGLGYQLSRSLTDEETVEFNFTPLYGIFKYDMEEGAYVIGHLGYNMFSGNEEFKNNGELSGGLYYAAGFGIGMEQYNGEIIYSVNNGGWEDDVDKFDVSYSKLSLSFGYEF